jgi:hypothetical protein
MDAAIVGAADVNVNARGVGTFGLGMLMFGRLGVVGAQRRGRRVSAFRRSPADEADPCG